MGKELSKVSNTFLFCDGGSCQKAGGEQVVRAARVYLRNNGLWDTTHTIKTRCNGRCEDAPTCIVQTGDYWYKDLTPKKITEIVASHTGNSKSVPEYLLYKDGDDKINSENERAIVKPKDFKLKEDTNLGWCFITKGFNSDQYLYPLFVYLQNNDVKGRLTFADGNSFLVNELDKVMYEDAYIMNLSFKNKTQVNLTIGAVPKEAPLLLVQSKVSSTEYFISKDKLKKGVRFKNKMGKFVAELQLDIEDAIFWQYCLDIQLLGKSNPVENRLEVIE